MASAGLLQCHLISPGVLTPVCAHAQNRRNSIQVTAALVWSGHALKRQARCYPTARRREGQGQDVSCSATYNYDNRSSTEAEIRPWRRETSLQGCYIHIARPSRRKVIRVEGSWSQRSGPLHWSKDDISKLWRRPQIAKTIPLEWQRKPSPEGPNGDGPRKWAGRMVAGVALAALLVGGVASLQDPPIATALTEENLLFLEAWRTVDRAYIDKGFNGQSWFRYRENALKSEPMTDREQTYAAIRKMLATLGDPFTRFLEPDKFATLKAGAKGAVTGVGLEVGFDTASPPQLVVVTPVTGGPAERAGVQPGDVILAIDKHSTAGMGLYDAAQRLQGPLDSEVEVTVRSEKSKEEKSVLVKREKITLNPVSWQLCSPVDGSGKLGYIRLSTFNSNSAASVKEAITKLKEEGASAFVLDIRNNSGGLFPAGIEIAKMWLPKGVIVFIEDSMGIRDIYDTEGEQAIATTEPLAVLVNKGTASASEILAGALKDNRRAVILGESTFGKGKIQSVFALSDGSGLAVTIARYVTPNKVDIDKVGITPDRPLPPSVPSDADKFCRCLAEPGSPCSISANDLFAASQR